MERLKIFFVIVVVLSQLGLVGDTFAAKPTGKAGGNSSGGGGNTPPDYGDLFVLYRNDNGVPYVTAEVLVPDPESGQYVTGGLCVQPLANISCPGECIVESEPTGQDVIDVDPITCSVPAECALCVSEVEFERDNVIRARESVLAQQLRDATTKLLTAGCVTLDPAGRPVASTLVDSEVISSTIDSPLQNLAFYKQFMTVGYIGDSQGGAIDLYGDDYLVGAARALGASSSKEGEVTVDMVVYMNQILGLTEDGASMLPRISVNVREEVKGVMKVVQKWFLDYSGYSYDRESNFSTIEQSLPSPAYIPDEFGYGQFEYLAKVGDVYVPTISPIISTVFDQTAFDGDQLTGFAQAADDTRAVINFMHSWPIPEEDMTPIPCDATISDFYDVVISEQSGLQVPVRMTTSGDGREGTLTLTNEGPATAYDVEISLIGTYTGSDGNEQTVLILDEMDGDSIFEDGLILIDSISPGYSVSVSFFFSMDQAATIAWTATAIVDDFDSNLSNNEVTEYTKVLLPNGHGGGDHE